MNGVTTKKYKAMKQKADRLTLRLFVDPSQRSWMKWTEAADALSKAEAEQAADRKPGDVETDAEKG
jgi:hypothetical protein